MFLQGVGTFSGLDLREKYLVAAMVKKVKHFKVVPLICLKFITSNYYGNKKL